MGLRAHNNHRRIQSPLHQSSSPNLLSALPSPFRLCGVCPSDVPPSPLRLLSLPSLSLFAVTQYFSLYLLSIPFFHPCVFSFMTSKLEIKEPRSWRLTFHFDYVIFFPFTSFSSVFLIDWPGGLADPERDEGLSSTKSWGFEHVMLFYLLTSTHTHAHTHTFQSRSVNTQTPAALRAWWRKCV